MKCGRSVYFNRLLLVSDSLGKMRRHIKLRIGILLVNDQIQVLTNLMDTFSLISRFLELPQIMYDVGRMLRGTTTFLEDCMSV